MTIEKAREILLLHCDKKIKTANKLRFLTDQGLDITLEITRVLKDYEKDANLLLPEKLCFPENSTTFIIDSKGVQSGNTLIKWDSIALTAIARHRIQEDLRNFRNEHYFICCLANGDIIERQIDNIEKHSNLLGHFIELYKTVDRDEQNP